MAGDWIAVRKDLATTREVLFIAQHTGQDIGTVIYAILRLWWWFDSEATDGFVSGLCPAFVHNFLGQDATFWRTVVDSGWLIEKDGGLAIPNPDNWHSKTAKARLLDSRRKRGSRQKQSASSPENVPVETGQEPDKSVTTGQDRTVKKKNSKSHSRDRVFGPVDERKDHPAVMAVRDTVKKFPEKENWNEIIAVIGAEPDRDRLQLCFAAWMRVSSNRSNLTWLFDWYRNGVPASRGNGKSEAVPLDNLAARGYGKQTYETRIP